MPVSKKVSISCNYPIKALCKKEKQVPLVRGKFWYFSFFFFFFLAKLMKTKERKPCSQGLSPYVLEEERPWKQQQRQNYCHFLDQSGKSPKPRDSPSVFFPRCTYLRLAYCSFLASYGWPEWFLWWPVQRLAVVQSDMMLYFCLILKCQKLPRTWSFFTNLLLNIKQ